MSTEIAKQISKTLNTEISKSEVNILLNRYLKDLAAMDSNYRWSLKDANRNFSQINSTIPSVEVANSNPKTQSQLAQSKSIDSEISRKYLTKNNPPALKPDQVPAGYITNSQPAPNSESLSLARLTSYYLEALSRERDSEIKLYAKPFDENRPNFIVLNGFPIYEDNTKVWPSVVRQYIVTKPRQQNVNLYIGYPVFVQKTRPGSSDLVFPLFLFNMQTSSADSTGLPTLDSTAPRINIEAFKKTGSSFGDLPEDLKGLRTELGLDAENEEDLPTILELIERLKTKYPLWPGQETLDIKNLSTASLDCKNEGGFYNSAILFWGEGSKFVQGLENELKEIRKINDPNKYKNSVLSNIIREKDERQNEAKTYSIHRHLPLNPSQVNAVESAMDNPLTVITGPPGTGKSQVVGSIITNAAMNGQSILVSSRNHKAIDVVVERVNCLSDRPFLLKLGSESSSSDVIHLVNTLTSSTQNQANHSLKALTIKSEINRNNLITLYSEIEQILSTQNRIAEIDQELLKDIESYGPYFKMNANLAINEKVDHFTNLINVISDDIRNVVKAKAAVNKKQTNIIGRLFWPLTKHSRLTSASSILGYVAGNYKALKTQNTTECSHLIK
ncbi:MAG: AAA domain-containing protein, partial [Bdellovibrionales bacterium]